jgi:hypothetical protein
MRGINALRVRVLVYSATYEGGMRRTVTAKSLAGMLELESINDIDSFISSNEKYIKGKVVVSKNGDSYTIQRSGISVQSPDGFGLSNPDPRTMEDRINAVYNFWRSGLGMGNGNTKLNSVKKKLIKARLKEWSVEQLNDAMRSACLSTWHVENGFAKPESVFKDDGRVEYHLDLLDKRRRESGSLNREDSAPRRSLRDAMKMRGGK